MTFLRADYSENNPLIKDQTVMKSNLDNANDKKEEIHKNLSNQEQEMSNAINNND